MNGSGTENKKTDKVRGFIKIIFYKLPAPGRDLVIKQIKSGYVEAANFEEVEARALREKDHLNGFYEIFYNWGKTNGVLTNIKITRSNKQLKTKRVI